MILVDRPDTVTARCKRLLIDLLPSEKFGFSQKGSQSKSFALTGAGQSTAQADKQYPVLPLSEAGGTLFWLAIGLTFESHLKRFLLRNVSIVFFEGEHFDPEKIPLIRAEWDDWPSEIHAQPHWHVYATTLEPAGERVTRLPDEPDIHDFLEPPDVKIEPLRVPRFHFSMCAGWYNNPPPSLQVAFSEVDACRWVAGCVRYTQAQLEFLAAGRSQRGSRAGRRR